jgi:hypothetical protein
LSEATDGVTTVQTNPLRTIDAAYIAGLIDGEGTITLSRKHRNENRQLAISIPPVWITPP